MRPITQYPENWKLRAGREFAIQVSIPDRFADCYWVKLAKGKQGKTVGRFLEGEHRGMIVFFDDVDQRHLTPDHYAVVTVDSRKDNFAFGSFTPLLLGERDESVNMATIIPGEFALYQAENLEDAKAKHQQKLKLLLDRVVEKRVLEIEEAQTSLINH